jgi:hypothetical protein
LVSPLSLRLPSSYCSGPQKTWVAPKLLGKSPPYPDVAQPALTYPIKIHSYILATHRDILCFLSGSWI